MIALYEDGQVALDASLADVEAAVRRLDGAEHSLVVVELGSGKTITAGGGPDRFVAEMADDARRHWCVVDPGAGSGTVPLVVGGERIEAPARVCVGRDAVLEAVLTFAAGDGARSERVRWSAEG